MLCGVAFGSTPPPRFAGSPLKGAVWWSFLLPQTVSKPVFHVARVFRDLGLTASQAIALFYRQVQLRHGLPFEVRVPNKHTAEALREAEAREGLTNFESVDGLFADLRT